MIESIQGYTTISVLIQYQSSSPTPATILTLFPCYLVTSKLTTDNFLLWKAQIISYFHGQQLFGYFDCSISTPPLKSNSLPNPAYHTWCQKNQIILSTLLSLVSKNSLVQVYTHDTSHVLQTTLEKIFTSHSLLQLAIIKKGGLSIANYFHKIKGLVNLLTMLDNPFKRMR